MRHYKSQLRSLITGAAIAAAGGLVFVATAGAATKATLYTNAGAALANPFVPTNGSLEFNVADTVATVDLYILSPTGHMVVLKGIKPSGDASIIVDNSKLNTTLIVPFAAANQAGDATETPTGFTIPGSVQPNVGIHMLVADATETIDAGTLASASGDADGFIVGLSVAGTTYIKATNANGAVTLGAKLYVQDSANAGDDFPEQDISQTGKQITYTLSAGSDTAAGFLILPVLLPVTSL